jgi:hypothetical protein
MNRGEVPGEDPLLKRLWFENNIVLARTPSMLTMRHATPTFNLVFDRNVYWRPDGGSITFFGLDWDAWRARGQDQDSMFADPAFVDAKNCDFRLKPGSPALKQGFSPFDLREAGPRREIGVDHAT